MNIEPRLDKNIPREFLYLKFSKLGKYDKELNDLKEKRDKESKKRREELLNCKNTLMEFYKKCDSEHEINLYSNVETIYSFVETMDRIDFNKDCIIKIDPVCMFKKWHSGGNTSYDLYSFKCDKIFYNQDKLMKELEKDNLIKEYILNTFLNWCYANEEFIEPRNNFMDYIINNYKKYRPSFADIVRKFKKSEISSCATYRADEHKIKYYMDAYSKGFVNIKDDFSIEETMIFILKHKQFDLIEEFFYKSKEHEILNLKNNIEKYKSHDTYKEIIKLLLLYYDDKKVSKLCDMLDIKPSGFILEKIDFWYLDRDGFLVESNHFNNITDVKKYIIKNYECDFDTVVSGNIDGMTVDDKYYLKLTNIQ